MTDFRARYYLEAERHIRRANESGPANLHYWSRLLCALVNATMASVPDTVLDVIIADEENKAKNQRNVQRSVRRDLNAK